MFDQSDAAIKSAASTSRGRWDHVTHAYDEFLAIARSQTGKLLEAGINIKLGEEERPTEFDIHTPLGLLHAERVFYSGKDGLAIAVIFTDRADAGGDTPPRELGAVFLPADATWTDSSGREYEIDFMSERHLDSVVFHVVRSMMAAKLAADTERCRRLSAGEKPSIPQVRFPT